MPSFNRVILIGHLGRDPEMRYTQNNTAVCGFSMAMNRKIKDREDEVTWVEVTAWSRIAEVIHQYVKKGDPLMVEGRLTLDEWDDKTSGEKRRMLKVTAENVQLMGQAGGGKKADPRPVANDSIPEDDIPF